MMKKIIKVSFFKQVSGIEPVREWLKSLPIEDKKSIGYDIKVVEFGWPLGLPLVKNIGKGIWEVRSQLPSKRITRVLFCMQDGHMVLLHGFIKKTQKMPQADLELTNKRKKELEKHHE